MLNKIRSKFQSTPKEPSVNDMLGSYKARDFHEHDMEVLHTPQYNDLRILFYEQYCEFCFKWLEVVDRFNLKLDRKAEPIHKVDVEGVHPVVQEFEPEGAPTLLIDGILVKGITTESFGKGFLQGFLEDEMVMK